MHVKSHCLCCRRKFFEKQKFHVGSVVSSLRYDVSVLVLFPVFTRTNATSELSGAASTEKYCQLVFQESLKVVTTSSSSKN